MRSPRRITTIYLAVLSGSMFAFAVPYWLGMAAYEGEQTSFLHAFRVVVETYTTTGYGSDAPWTSPEMNLFVIAMNTVGTIMIFLALPVFLTPALRNALERSPPTSLDHQPTDHVILASKSPRMEPLTGVLADRNVEYAVVESDEETAMELHESGVAVLHGSPANRAALEAANVREARALVVDVEDRQDASIVLTARELDQDVRVVSVVDEPGHARYHRLAGADAVLSPRPVVGQRLAEMATAAVRTDLGEHVELGEELRIAELPIARAGELESQTVEQAGLLEDGGDLQLGALWHDGEFERPVEPDRVLTPGTVLLIVGTEPALGDLAESATGRPRAPASGETIVVGHGEVGRAVTSTLEEWNLPYTVVDLAEREDVDVVGDATHPDVLEEAGVADADAVVIAIPDDAETEFTALVARDASDRIHVAARADDDGSLRRLYRAGADYVLPVNDVTGRLLGSTVLDDDVVLAADTRVEIVEVGDGDDDGDGDGDGDLVGRTLTDAEERLGGDCTAVAVERGGELFTTFEDAFELRAGDRVALVGTDEGLATFTEEFA